MAYSYNAVYRLVAATAGQTALTFTFAANTDKQLATIYHPATAVREVWISRVAVILGTGAAGVFSFELQPLSAATAPATGNPAIVPGKYDQGSPAAEATCLALPTTAGSLVAANSPVGTPFSWNAAAATAMPNPAGIADATVDLFRAGPGMDGGVPLLKIRKGVAEGYAVIGRCTTAVALRYTVIIEFTERA